IFDLYNLHSSTSFYSMIVRSPIYTLFPYTTLFRSFSLPFGRERTAEINDSLRGEHEYKVVASVAERTAIESAERAVQLPHDGARSEEHTSELQSRFDLVCRLLLEKKNLDCSS